jgi:hypothetical protein
MNTIQKLIMLSVTPFLISEMGEAQQVSNDSEIKPPPQVLAQYITDVENYFRPVLMLGTSKDRVIDAQSLSFTDTNRIKAGDVLRLEYYQGDVSSELLITDKTGPSSSGMRKYVNQITVSSNTQGKESASIIYSQNMQTGIREIPDNSMSVDVDPYDETLIKGGLIDGQSYLKIDIIFQDQKRYSYYAQYARGFVFSALTFTAFYSLPIFPQSNWDNVSSNFWGTVLGPSNVSPAVQLVDLRWNRYKNDGLSSYSWCPALIFTSFADPTHSRVTGFGAGMSITINDSVVIGLGWDIANSAVNIFVGKEIVTAFKAVASQ